MIHGYILYGAGKRCRNLCNIIRNSEVHVEAIVDSNPEMWGLDFEGYKIESPSVIPQYPTYTICITVLDNVKAHEIRDYIKSNYFHREENEISYDKLLFEAYKTNIDLLDSIKKAHTNIKRTKSFLFDCSNGLGLGGVEQWTKSLCENLLDAGMNTVYILSDAGEYDTPVTLNDHILYVNIDHGDEFQKNNVTEVIYKILEKLPCKVITQFTNVVMLASFLIKRCYPDLIEIISVVHNSYGALYKRYSEFRECSDKYVCVSQDIVEDMGRMLGESSSSLYSMNIPFACERILQRQYTVDFDSPLCVGYAGRIEVIQKRMDLLLKVVESLVKRKVNFKLELAGDGIYLQAMKEYIKNHNLDRYVRFLGKLERSEMMDFWKRQDVCINVADHEGRSISITEAMGAGAIPVVTATSGTKEDIFSGKNGFIVPIGDGCAIAERIEYLSKHREKLLSMGKLAHDVIYPKSLMEPHVDFWKNLLLEKKVL